MNNRLRNVNQQAPKNITINDIADDLGVSKTTISRAISGKGRIGNAMREKVLSYIEVHGYRPNLIAKSLAVSKTFNIAVALPTDTEVNEIPFFQTCLQSITNTVTGRDYDVVISVMSSQDITGLKRLILNQKVDGVILTRLLTDDRAVAFLQEEDIPFVVIGTSSDPSIIQIDSDHLSGCREVTAHVLENSRGNVILLAGDGEHHVNKDRYAGFASALADAGMKEEDVSVIWNLKGNEQIEKIMGEVMKKKPDCLVCMDDVICGFVLAWLQKNRFEVPRDVKIASFHDSAAMEHHNPPVTALHIHVQELGASAGTILLDAIEGKDVPYKNRVGYEFIIRGSTRAH